MVKLIMSLFSQLLAVAATLMMLAAVFYVLFGQITVRRLRRNKATKDLLGFEFVSGMDIVNAAQALTLPRAWMKKLEQSPISAMFSRSELLYQNTSSFDRIIARVFYCLLMFSGLGSCILLMLNALGILE